MPALNTLYPLAIVALIASVIFGMIDDSKAGVRLQNDTLTLQGLFK